jgi:hypothetical protein
LPYIQQVQPWEVMMLNTGSVINLYLEPKKSNQVNVLAGFLPIINSWEVVNSFLRLMQTSSWKMHLEPEKGSVFYGSKYSLNLPGSICNISSHTSLSRRSDLTFRLIYSKGFSFSQS